MKHAEQPDPQGDKQTQAYRIETRTDELCERERNRVII